MMQANLDTNEAAPFHFQVDLLNLNLHLAETESAPEVQTHAHEVALNQMRSLAPRA